MNRLKIVLAALLLFGISVKAQSDGPRAHLPAPTGLWAINLKYMNLDQNILPSGNILLPNANINVDVFPITFIHTFGIRNRWARVSAMIAPISSFSATLDNTSIPINQIQKSGFSDGWVSFEFGLINNPAKNVIEFSKTSPAKFTMNGQFRFWYSGTYSADNLVNLGSNRMTFDFGFPMSIRLNNNSKQPFWLEVWPGLQFYTANNNPARPSFADKITQKPLLYLENHLSYNFTPKFYGGVDLRFQQGGQTSHDAVKDDNQISIIGGGAFVGYKILPYLDFWANYGEIIAGDNDAKSSMIRLNLTFSYINMKKYKTPE